MKRAISGKDVLLTPTSARGSAPSRHPSNGLSLADRTTEELLNSIMSGRFMSGRLPPEPELAVLLSVSRTTIRTALQRLETAGLVSRAPARGTLVRPYGERDTLALQRMVGFHELLEERGHTVRTDVRWEVRDAADPLTHMALGLGPGTTVLRSAKTFFADERPAIFIWDELPLSLLTRRTAAEVRRGRTARIPDSIFAFSRSWPERQIHHSIVSIEPKIARRGDPAELRIPVGSPYIVLAEVHHAQDSGPVAYSRVHVDDRFLRFRVVRNQ